MSAGKARIGYRHASVDALRWVAWAINTTGSGMQGAQALMAYQQSDSSMRAYMSPISRYQTQLQEGNLRPLSGGSPGIHATTGATIQSKGTLNLAADVTSGGGNSKLRQRN
ncbi:hypothetical protein MLD38_019441 [Melastoma candidum]|uniref:Uncharacterized protein n=1 Tax=Melastoma candidum TaxID=119954 RepID=A0ACB9QX09_9MYRT|nr:hypothetical protein MLD38_019441 [Melastoma candidum]